MSRGVIKMERSTFDKAYDHISGICRNYPHWPSTFGTCQTDACNNHARGYGLCADCHEKELSKYSGVELARKFHESVKAQHTALYELRHAIKEI